MSPRTVAISKPRTREWAALAACLLAMAAFGLRPSIRGIDGVGNYVYVGSLLADGDLDFSNQYREFGRMQNLPIGSAAGPASPRTGLAPNRFGVGSSLMWAPFVVPMHLVLKAKGLPADGMTRPYEWAVGMGTFFWAVAGLAMLFWRLRREFDLFGAACTAAGLVLATPLGFYMYAHGSMSHGVSFFAMVAAVLAVERAWTKPGLGAMAICGAMLALVVEIRFQDASWAGVLAAALAVRQWRMHRMPMGRMAGLWGVLGLAGLIVFLPQLAAWKILYGVWLSGPLPYLDSTAGSFNVWPRRLADALFSEHGGALAWHPLLAIGLVGLAMSIGSRWRAVAWVGLIGFAAQAWLVGSWSVYWAGASFGNRFFISALPLLAFGIARVFNGDKKRVKILVLIALIAWNTGLLIQYANEMYPREAAVSWWQVIKQNVVDVPRWILKRLGR